MSLKVNKNKDLLNLVKNIYNKIIEEKIDLGDCEGKKKSDLIDNSKASCVAGGSSVSSFSSSGAPAQSVLK